MMQQINLYQPMFRKQKKVFSAVAMAQVFMFFVVVFAAIYFFSLQQIKPFEQQVGKLDKDIAQLTTHISKFEQQQVKKAKSKLLEKEVERLTKELEKRERIQNLLSSHSFGSTTGFSSHLEAFARQHINGAWLTRILITGGGNALGLEGKILYPELLPSYIQKLSNEKALAGAAFNNMELNRIEGELDQFDFKVSTN